MSVNEDKIREAIKEIKTWGFAPLPVDMIVSNLEAAITPPAPEIPEGCPVLVWVNDDCIDKHSRIFKKMINKPEMAHINFPQYEVEGGECYLNCEIDYQRKGHVIPWHGGECPVDGLANLQVYWSDGKTDQMRTPNALEWEHRHGKPNIIAYVIWPEWMKL